MLPRRDVLENFPGPDATLRAEAALAAEPQVEAARAEDQPVREHNPAPTVPLMLADPPQVGKTKDAAPD